jgi:hypothetical protein
MQKVEYFENSPLEYLYFIVFIQYDYYLKTIKQKVYLSIFINQNYIYHKPE